MNKPLLNKALIVGAFVAFVAAAFLVAFTFLKKGGYSSDESYLVDALFSDATGLSWKSKVQIAGIQVGEVATIKLEGDRARLRLRIKNEIPVHADACLVKSFPSALLPDALLELSPGSPDQPLLRSLPDGQRQITCVREATSMQQLLNSMSGIAADIKLLTGDLAKTVNGPRGSMKDIVENLAQVTRRIDELVAANQGRITQILANVEALTGDVKDVTGSEKERVKRILANVEELSAQLAASSHSLQSILDGQPGLAAAAGGTGAPAPAGSPGAAGPAGAAGAPGAATAGATAAAAPTAEEAKGIKQAVAKANDSLAKLDALLAELQAGKSVASKLITDEKMGRQLSQTVDAVSGYYGSLNRLQVEVELRSEWLLNQSGAKTFFGMRLLPRPDKYYILEIVSDPRGVDTTVTDTWTVRDPATGQDTTTVTTKTRHELRLTFTVQMAKRLGPLALRAGMIESSGGAGADLFLLQDRLQISMSVYQFSRPYSSVFPRTKLYANYRFFQHLYVTAGADDFLNRWRGGRYPGGPSFALGTDVFFGGGIFFTDDDLKLLIGSGAATAAGTAITTNNGASFD